MFWQNFITLCSEHNTTPTAVVSKLGLAKGNVTSWKSGKTPQATTLKKIADHFGVDESQLVVDLTKSAQSTTKKEMPSVIGEHSDHNVVITIGRDGTYTKKRLTDEQIKALQTLIDQMPDVPDEV